MTILPLLSLVLTLRKGFVYLLDVDIYTYSLLFSSLLQHISYHFALHLAPFYLAFCTILPCVLHHFTLRFAAKRGAFSSILHFILVHIAQNLAPVACLCNGKQYATIHMQPPFRIATNPREN